MPSREYDLLRQAVLQEKQVTCRYGGKYRELCPIIIGHTAGEEKLLAFQFGGETSSRLPPGGEWRCLRIADVTDIRLRDGPWHEGRGHQTTQSCVTDVDLDVNIHVRNRR